MENAAYLQNTENVFDNQHSTSDNGLLNFEVDSIELATPELFSEDLENKSLNRGNKNQKDPKIFENLSSNKETETKEQEMFEETNLEEDFEIPAFLRKQKN